MELVISETDLSEKEHEELEEALIREWDLDRIHQVVLNNTVLKAFGSKVSEFKTHITYSYPETDDEGKIYIEDKDIYLTLKRNPLSNTDSPYLIKILGHYLAKKDFLSLYHAFVTIIKTKAEYLEKSIKEPERNKIDNQMALFPNEFYEPQLKSFQMSIYIKPYFGTKDVKLEFELTRANDGYGFRLDKDTTLSYQDIYFIHTNFEKIIQSSLDFDVQTEID
mgnify:CR=1 FL=1